MRPTLSEIEAVTKVAQTRSFRGAAQALGVSASALSHSIAALEKRLGARLFHRTTRSVALTDEGDAFVARVTHALRTLDDAVEDVHARRASPSGTLRLVTPSGLARTAILPPVLEMRRRHPDVSIELVTDARYLDIVAEGYDAGVRYPGLVPRDMVAVPCGPDMQIAVVASPRYLAAHGKPRVPRDLEGHECLRYRKSSGIVRHWELRVEGRATNVEVEGHLVFDDETFLIDAALDGAGLAYVTHAAAFGHLASGELVRVLERYSPRFEPVQVFYPPGLLMRAALRAFLDVVKEGRKKRQPLRIAKIRA